MLYGQENPTGHMELDLTETTKGRRQLFWSAVKIYFALDGSFRLLVESSMPGTLLFYLEGRMSICRFDFVFLSMLVETTSQPNGIYIANMG